MTPAYDIFKKASGANIFVWVEAAEESLQFLTESRLRPAVCWACFKAFRSPNSIPALWQYVVRILIRFSCLIRLAKRGKSLPQIESGRRLHRR